MNKLILSVAAAASAANALQLEAESQAPYISINVGTPDDFDENNDETFVEINVGEVDSGEAEEELTPTVEQQLNAEEMALIENLMNHEYDFSDDNDVPFIHWMYANDREYTSVAEYIYRLHQFVEDQIAADQNNNDETQTSLIVVNEFSDKDPEELDLLLSSGLLPDQTLMSAAATQLLATDDLPVEVNWVERGAVNPVRQ